MPEGAAPGRAHWRYRRGLGGELLAEVLGTFVLILLGCGSVAVALAALPESGRQTAEFGAANWLIIIWGWGFGVVFGVYTAGGASGAHINPAVTLAFAVRRAFPLHKVVPYWFAQVVGAFLAAALVHAVYAPAIDAYNASEGITRAESLDTFSIFATFPAEYFGGGWWGPLLDQVVGTAILVGLICALLDKRNMAPGVNLAPFLIGMVVTVVGLTFGPNAGYAINPARDFGPRLWTYLAGWGDIALPGSYEWFSWYFWIPIVGPLIGGVLGALVYDLFIGQVLAVRDAPESGRVPE
ncbi:MULTISPECIES: MIP/aquaporin family protein [unclassified Actinopolyspora]|uniref:MIP/aquaporin family protein n=1 Tax=unclassified Actinopolyspora TaxID=2639451 RepID=UPI0013F69AE9|nr:MULTISPECIES: MIP/aquaporin family protein [unclassified Actinopolyspora]NHD19061.1 aquaporin family protein [Actinopolyspora sp. BKK2]NHE78154.1 aquaporin family protein [Actinopolyspora sp. BKK1]